MTGLYTSGMDLFGNMDDHRSPGKLFIFVFTSNCFANSIRTGLKGEDLSLVRGLPSMLTLPCQSRELFVHFFLNSCEAFI